MGIETTRPEQACRHFDKKELIILCVISGVSLILLLANLSNQYMWEDEAQTALISRTILTEGVPRGYDGRNYFSQELEAEYGDNYIWRWHTWLPFYVLAGFYKIFGVSTFVSRLPFAFFGFGTVIMTYFFAQALWPKTRIPLIAAALLSVSVPFLLLSRQCRYYSMVMFFAVLSLHCYRMLLDGKKYAGVMLVVSASLLFHSQYFYTVVLFAVMLLHAVIFGRNRLKLLLTSMGIAVLLNVGWVVWLGANNFKIIGDIRTEPMTGTFVTNIERYVFPAWLGAVLLIVVIARIIRSGKYLPHNRQFWDRGALPVLFIVFNIILFSIVGPYPFFRYLAPSIPMLVIIIAVLIDAAGRVNIILAIATAAALVATSPMKNYLYEITHDYDGPIEGISHYLNEHGSPEDIVAITYGDMPLKFYTSMRVIGGLTGEELTPALNARWVIIRNNTVGKEGDVIMYLTSQMELDRYRKIELDYPDISWENREEPRLHYYRTQSEADKVIIYERIE